MCGRRLYDDFQEFSPGAVQVLQWHLDKSDLQLDRSIRSTEPSGPHDSDPDPTPDRFERAEGPVINSVQKLQTESIYDKFRNRDIDILRRCPFGARRLWLLPFVCLAENGAKISAKVFPISAFDIYDRTNPPDTELFIHVKQRYLKAKGRFSRFLSPQRLKIIQALYVSLSQVT